MDTRAPLCRILMTLLGAATLVPVWAAPGTTQTSPLPSARGLAKAATSPGGAPPPSGKATSQGVTVAGMVLARDDGQGRNGRQVQGFTPRDNPLHCVVRLSRGQVGVRVRFRWFALEAGDAKNYLIRESLYTTTSADVTVANRLSLARPWPVGRYRVTAQVMGAKGVATIDFRVR